MLAHRRCFCTASTSHRSIRVPVTVIRQHAAFSRRQGLLLRAQADRMPAVETAVKLEQGYTYLDVRTPEEFAAGRPVGSVNIPIMFKTAEGMQLNSDFLEACQQAFPDAAIPLVVGCKAGNRSARACALLTEAKYSDLVDNAGGYDGWVAASLPVEK